MTDMVHIADMKRRVLAAKARLSADVSQEEPQGNDRIVVLLESVEKTLLRNQDQVRRLKQTSKALVIFCVSSWLFTAALFADRLYSDFGNDSLSHADSDDSFQAVPSRLRFQGFGENETSTGIDDTQSVGGPPSRDQSALREASWSETRETVDLAPIRAQGGVQDVDNLLVRPHAYHGLPVEVIGSVVRLFQRYRLRSETSQKTIMIDVEGLPQPERAKLGDAIERAELLGKVRVRIFGRIERGENATFHLAAYELVVLDSSLRPVNLGRDR